MIERQTYSLLDLLGDVGGLFDALKLIGGVLMFPFVQFSLRMTLLI